MENIIIEARGHTPYVEFNLDGHLKMEGRSIPENINSLYDPLVEFVKKLEVGNVVFNINLDYFNTATSKKLLEIMKHLEANNKINEIMIIWHFEEGDEDSIEMAEIYEECLIRTSFIYKQYSEAA
jgi:sulfatase maturation enzyme AslB (radical SAM superfamily)